MAVTKEQPFPQALAGIAAGYQNAEPTYGTWYRRLDLAIRNDAGRCERCVKSVQLDPERVAKGGADRSGATSSSRSGAPCQPREAEGVLSGRERQAARRSGAQVNALGGNCHS